jgi:hypothetical protein
MLQHHQHYEYQLDRGRRAYDRGETSHHDGQARGYHPYIPNQHSNRPPNSFSNQIPFQQLHTHDSFDSRIMSTMSHVSDPHRVPGSSVSSSSQPTTSPSETIPGVQAPANDELRVAKQKWVGVPDPAPTTRQFKQYHWSLVMRQQPDRARMCGFGDKVCNATLRP